MTLRRTLLSLCCAATASAQTVEPFAATAGTHDHQSEASVAFVGGSDFLVVWSDERIAPGIDIYANVFRPGADPAGEFFVCSNSYDQNEPFVAADPAGGWALGAFRDARGTLGDVYGQWLSLGGGVAASGTDAATNFTLDPGGGVQDFPQIAAGGGVFLVVVDDRELDADSSATCGASEGTCGDIAAHVFAPGATTPSASPVITSAPGFQVTPSVAWDEDGALFVVAWADWRNDLDQDGACDEDEESCHDVRAQAVDAAGALSGGELVVVAAAGKQAAPSAAGVPGGGVLVAWEDLRDPDGTHWDVYARRVIAGVPAAEEIAVSINDALQRAPRVASCADDERFVVAFQDSRAGPYFETWIQMLEADGEPWGTNFSVAPALGAQSDVSVACGGGQVALAWTDWRNSTDPGPDETAGTDDDPVSDVYGAFVALDAAPNNPPAQPENVSPAQGSVDVHLDALLSGSEFVDIDGDAHASSRWQVCADEACADVVHDSEDSGDLTAHALPAGALLPDTTYYWTVRYTDDAGRTSPPSAATSFDTIVNQPPDTPANVAPADGATDVSTAPALEATEFGDPDGDEPVSSEWQFCTDENCTNVPALVLDAEPPVHQHQLEGGRLLPETSYFFRVRYQDARGALSEWSALTSLTTRAEHAPDAPANLEPADAAEGVALPATLSASAFADADGDAHLASEWAVCLDSQCAYPLYGSGALTTDLTSHAVPEGELHAGMIYVWRVRYQDETGRWSEWSVATSFTTVAGEADAEGEDDGCGCRLGRRGAGGAAPLALLGLLLALAGRARRRRGG